MILLPLLDVAFIGLVGADPGHVDRQILQAEPRLVVKKVASAEVSTIAKRDDGAADAVTALGVDGVVTGELVGIGKNRSLRLVIYRANGAMASLSETALVRGKLGKDDIEVLQSNLGDEIGELIAKAPKKPGSNAKKAMSSPSVAGPATEMSTSDPFADAFDAPATKAKPSRKTGKVVKAEPKAEPKPEPKAVPNPDKKIAKTTEPSLADELAAAPPAAPKQVAEATETDSDSVSADEIAAMTGGDPASDAALSTAATSSSEPADLHLAGTAGFGVTGRGFTPGTSTLTGYQANSVGAVHLDAVAEPLPHARIAVAFERTLGMNSTLGQTSMSTTISRWEANAAYGIRLGKLEIAPELGLGVRAFSMDSAAIGRTPDTSYTYVIAGVEATLPVTDRVTVHALATLEPVIDGTDALAMEYGSATRWAFDAGGSIDVRASQHIYVRALADYQQFNWSWSMAGTRGAGGAVDSYPTAAFALAARY